jgi:NAD(P)-dependent dehydrogenase (short-subunit alcohol dehydrogenase family)
MRLAGKIAVVTGASRGIGLAIARALAAEGCQLALTARHAEALNSVAGDLSAFAKPCDVRNESSVEAFFAAVRERFGRLDVLVNNAGVAHALQNVEQLPLAIWREVIDTNLTGTFLCTRAALPLMNRGGFIINNLSIAAHSGFPGFSAYDASKRGALGFTNTLREELRPRGIRVLALVPGATATDIWDQFMPEAKRATMLLPESVAAMVVQAVALPEDTVIEEIRMLPISGTSRT